MSTLATLVVKLVGDISDFTNKMTQSEGIASRVGSSMRGIGTGLTLGLTVPIAGAGVAALGMASDLEESKNKVNVVFGDMSGAVEGFASTAATNLGLSEQAALEATGTFGNLFTAMELGKDQSADMSLGLVTLAADLASFNNIDPTVALEKLRAGIVGEVEPLRTLGVNLSAAAVQAKALEMGLVPLSPKLSEVKSATSGLEDASKNLGAVLKGSHPIMADEAAALKLVQDAFKNSTDAMKDAGAGSMEYEDAISDLNSIWAENASLLSDDVNRAIGFVVTGQDDLRAALEGTADTLTPAMKAQAAYALIMEQTKNAQGDFARTSDGLANSQRIIKAEVSDLAATFGSELLPIGLKIVDFVKDLLGQFLALDPQTRTTIITIAGIAAAAGPVILALGMLIGAITSIGGAIGAAIPMITPIITFMTGPLGLAIMAVVGLIALLALAWRNNWGGIQEKTAAAVAFVKGVIDNALTQIKFWWDEHGAAVMTIIQFLWTTLQNIFNAGKTIITNIITAVTQFIQGIWAKHGAEISGAVSWLWETIMQTFQAGADIIGFIVEAIAALIEGDWDSFKENMAAAAQLLWDTIQNIFLMAKENLKLAVSIIIETIRNYWNGIDWAQLGRNLLQGIARGITATTGFIVDAAKKAAKAALQAIKDLLGIQSPSRVFYELGRFSGVGLARGLLSGRNPVERAGARLAAAAAPESVQPFAEVTNNAGKSVTYQVIGNFKPEPETTITDALRLLTLAAYG